LNQTAPSTDKHPEDTFSEYLVETHALNLSFGSKEVLRDLSLQIRHGQTVAIIGESGCGKTVLLKSLIGLQQPTSGFVLFDQQDLGILNDRELSQLRTRTGFVFQQAALFDSLTIGENIAFPLLHAATDPDSAKLSATDHQHMVAQALREVGLPADTIYQYPADLSGGMRKRVGLARALILQPELVLYDEPTTGLDPIVSDIINELIMRSRIKHRVTSILVTHNMKTARKVADRILMLYPLERLNEDESQIIFDGPPSELEHCSDRRVQQFIQGEAGSRLTELGLA
tara:strand:+ start:8928 stop:9785 length:858 start_codon:yes stop_codon:yes gene_type:complete